MVSAMARQREFDREAALDRAMTAFWSKGYAATSIEDSAARMGIQRGSLYGTFGDKRTLFLTALDRYQRVVARELVEALDAPGSGIAAIRQFFRLRVEGSLDRRRPPGCLVTNSAVELSGCYCGAAAKVDGSLARIEAAFLRARARACARDWRADRPPGSARPRSLPDEQRPGSLGHGPGRAVPRGARGRGRRRSLRARERTTALPAAAGVKAVTA